MDDDVRAEEMAPAAAPDEVGTAPWREAVAALCLGTAAIHFSLVPPQFGDDAAYGVGLVLAAWAALAAGMALVVRPTRAAALSVVVVQTGLVVAWIVVHTAGAPFGSASGRVSEPGTPDSLAMALGVLAILITSFLLLGLASWFARPVVGGVALGCAATLAAIASTAGVISAAQESGATHGHDHAAMPADGHDHGAMADGGHDHGAMAAGGHDHTDEHEHGAGDHGDGHEHGGPMPIVKISDDDRRVLAQQLVEARTVAERFPTAADAVAAGYIPAGPVGAGGGAHYVNLSLVGQTELDIQRPMSLLYSDVADDAEIIGIMYYLDSGQEPPDGFAGDSDRWHLHTGACFIISGDDIQVPFRVDADVTQEQCDTVDGAQFVDRTGWMLHAWVVPGWDSPHGVFSDLNPAFFCPEGTAPTGEVAAGCEPVSG